MKKFYFFVCLVLAAWFTQAQAPAGFNYQAVIRNETGELVKNKTIGIRFTIVKGSEYGAQVYSEAIYPTTNINGLVTAEIGKTNPSQFSQINWSDGIYFLKTDTDPNGGNNYTITGTSQLLSVPYALYALKSGNTFSGNYNDLTNRPNLSQVAVTGNYSDLLGEPTLATVATTGNYSDLLNKPALATVATSGNYSDLTGRPTLATVATTGSYSDLLGKPALATVATTGNFNDLLNMPILVKLLKNPQAGDIIYNNGTNWELLARGTNGQTLRLDNGLPNWGEPGYALPMVTTSAVTDVLQTGAKCGGNIVATGFSNITARGVCWSTNQNPTVADNKTSDGSGIGTFNSTITNLTSNTTYYLRAYATNSAGTAYGNQVTFKTILNVVFPTVSTAAATNITSTAVTSGGNVTVTGGGEVTARGVCWSDHQNPTVEDSKTNDGSGTGEFRSQISGMIPGTYYIRAYATNSAGTGYGNMITVTNEKTLPVLTTKAITEISAMGCVTGGNITSAGGGTISERGICWSESPNPTVTNTKSISPSTANSFSHAITSASPGTTYYLKAYATNEIGTSYGDQKTFTTPDAAYYTSFESGILPTGFSGSYEVTTERSFNGSYSCMSLYNYTCNLDYNCNLSSAGQISFYFAFYNSGDEDNVFEFYIDDVRMVSFPKLNTNWKQCVFNVPAGSHKFTWRFNDDPNSMTGSKVFIDQIIITK